MPETNFPKSEKEIVSTLMEIYRHQGNAEISSLISTATARLEETGFDNWDGGVTLWSLVLELPIPSYSLIEPRTQKIEKDILSKLSFVNRQANGNQITSIVISPRSPFDTMTPHVEVNEQKSERIWSSKGMRLFLSHLATDKLKVSALKEHLKTRGVSAFVAHEDITPSLEWRDEIELALQTMDALVALITPGFHDSQWTDQEIGWALGRGLLVLPVRLGIDPRGFAGKYQGVSGTLDNISELANGIVKALNANPNTSEKMRRSFMTAFCSTGNFSDAQMFRKILPECGPFTESEKEEIWKACANNDQIYNAFGVVSAVYDAIGRPQKSYKESKP